MAIDKVDAKEREKIEAVRKLLRKQAPLSAKQAQYCNDACVERFLRSRGESVKKAAKHLRTVLSWRETVGAGVSNQAGLPQVPLPEIVRAPAGVHAGGGRRVHVPVRGPVRPPLRRKLFPLGVGVPQPAHGHAQDRRRLLPRPPPPRLRHRPAVPLLRPLEGSAAVRGARAGDGGGVLAGLRGLAGGRLVHGVPADGVSAVRAGGRRGEGRRRLGLVAVLRHPHRQPRQAVVPLHHPGARGLALRGAHQQPVARRRVPALRALLLLRVPRRAALHGRHAAAVPARRRGRAADAVLRRQGPEDPAAGAAAVPADSAAVVPAVAVHAVRVPQGRAGQPRGARARVLPPVPALLPPALRRDILPRQDAPAARRPHLHRRREVQAEAGAAAAAPARRTPPAAPPPLPTPAEDLISIGAA